MLLKSSEKRVNDTVNCKTCFSTKIFTKGQTMIDIITAFPLLTVPKTIVTSKYLFF